MQSADAPKNGRMTLDCAAGLRHTAACPTEHGSDGYRRHRDRSEP